MSDLRDVIDDLRSEAEELDRTVVDLDADGWAAPTAVPGWTVGHQIAHLAALYRLIGLAASDPVAFTALTTQPRFDLEARLRASLSGYLLEPPGALFPRWHTERHNTAAVLASLPPGRTVPWLGGSLEASALAGAAITELFRHDQDIADALGLSRKRTDRVRHAIEFGLLPESARYRPTGWTPPGPNLHVFLTAPSGTLWEYGPADSREQVVGAAEDFCLLVTGHGHQATDVLASGPEARAWLAEAQGHPAETA